MILFLIGIWALPVSTSFQQAGLSATPAIACEGFWAEFISPKTLWLAVFEKPANHGANP